MFASALAIAALAAGALAPAAAAQNDLTYNVPDLTTPGLNASLLNLNRPASPSPTQERRKPPKATAKQLRALRFKASASRTRAIDAGLLTALKGSTPEPAHAELDRLVNEGEYRRGVDRITRGLGGSPLNLADRVGTGLVIAWIAHDRERDPSPTGEPTTLRLTSEQVRGGRAFLRELRHALARSAKVRRLSDANKQRAGDTFLITALHVDTLVRALSDQGLRMPAAELQDALAGAVRKTFGVDLRRIELTGKGFKRA